MKKLLSVFLSVSLIFTINISQADEGMWLLSLIKELNMEEMKEKGLELSAEDIYSINNSSLKDAVVSLDRGSCTAEVISSEGLLLTNHHCGYGEIQDHSTPEHDYLKNGFWAPSNKKELPNPGKTATFLVRMEEVTKQVLDSVNSDMTEKERQQKIREVTQNISKEATDKKFHEAYVRSMFKGNRYFLFITKTYKDVRLVGAPPESIGKFGGDTDNWMWPRHTGDFSLFRIYANPDGSPAEYSEDNVPLEPKHYLPISLDGYEEGDFSMTLGFAGRTQRYLPSWGVKQVMEITNPTRISVREKKQNIMKAAMDSSEKIRIQYASKYAQSSNYYKYSIGQNKQLKRLNVIQQKKDLEDSLREWISQKPKREEKYGDVLNNLEDAYKKLRPYQKFSDVSNETLWQGAEVLLFATKVMRNSNLMSKNRDTLQNVREKLRRLAEDHFEDYHAPTDKKIFVAMMNSYKNQLDEKYHPRLVNQIDKNYGSMKNFADSLYAQSVFTNQKRFNAFIEDITIKKLRQDVGFMTMVSFMRQMRTQRKKFRSTLYKKDKNMRLFVQALLKMQKDQKHYPDANSTMRFSYGDVADYEPKDAVKYNYYTTLKGVMQKKDPDDEEFHVPDKLEKLYKNKNYGRYGVNGTMRTCFITDNDITGGNSGSPVINGKGHLIGTAFDGNWEAMSGDIKYVPEVQRCINVDIRYVLFVIDKFAGAQRLIDEMKIVE